MTETYNNILIEIINLDAKSLEKGRQGWSASRSSTMTFVEDKLGKLGKESAIRWFVLCRNSDV